MTAKWVNWGGNQMSFPQRIALPSSEKEIVSLIGIGVANRWKIRPVGSSHSFSPICATDGLLIDLSAFNEILHVDRESLKVTVGAGLTLAQLNIELSKYGMALPNLGDIDSQTLAGAIATGTHGTGSRHFSISAAVIGLRIATGDGSVIDVSESQHPEIFECARVNLGAFGIVISVTLQCVKSFNLFARELTSSIDDVIERFDDEDEQSDFVEFYWYPHTEIAELKINNRTSDPVSHDNKFLRELNDEILRNATFGVLNRYWKHFPQYAPGTFNRVLKIGSSNSRVDQSYKIFCSKRRVKFLEMEYAVPREVLLEVFQRVREATLTLKVPVTFPIEVRTLGGDDIPLSPAFGRQTGFIAVHVYKDANPNPYFERVESIMRDFEGRPHWGKIHTLTCSDLAKSYPKWERFLQIRTALDPDGHFTNAYLERVLGY
ncbi:MAG: D-arabinono-1,4-lactone oxidase [Actinomycetota bacterium]|nr:D-arabinono-1,4-lactone oxidase [Actinomycetota bacterium]